MPSAGRWSWTVDLSPDDPSASGHPSTSRRTPSPNFGHLRTLTDRLGVWEHARYSVPRREHGFCTDDNARALVVVSRQAAVAGGLSDLAATYLGFVLEARSGDGNFHNRRNAEGTWIDDRGSDDSQGRAWWGLGCVARLSSEDGMRREAVSAWDTFSFSSPHLRANAYAALGAAEMVELEGMRNSARRILDQTTNVIAATARTTIPWPETRLTYDNARLPEALIAAGFHLGDQRRLALGLRLLEWLVATETNDDHFSFTPAAGWSPGEPRPGFDQQPLECWAMADACYRAWAVTGQSIWRARAFAAVRWFLGDNDTGAVIYDEETGATSDGLMAGSVNQNRGAESTLAGLGALQIPGRCAVDDSKPR